MKKIMVIILCVTALFASLVGCGNEPKTNGAILWFDSLHGEKMNWNGNQEYSLEEFPGVTFRCNEKEMEAVMDGEAVSLYSGMPIWSVYFYDLTGDGKPELCSTISFGSGIVDNRIIVYDYAKGTSYELSDRGTYDYILNIQEDTLIVEKRTYMQDERIESGNLIFLNNGIHMQTED